uniref:tRNA (guanine(26)-N(2))-dimethyltransferase n=1 Tax=Homalodisca liturata TaxID=320908 RepID=A0A1B6IPS7_9HEMI
MENNHRLENSEDQELSESSKHYQECDRTSPLHHDNLQSDSAATQDSEPKRELDTQHEDGSPAPGPSDSPTLAEKNGYNENEESENCNEEAAVSLLGNEIDQNHEEEPMETNEECGIEEDNDQRMSDSQLENDKLFAEKADLDNINTEVEDGDGIKNSDEYMEDEREGISPTMDRSSCVGNSTEQSQEVEDNEKDKIGIDEKCLPVPSTPEIGEEINKTTKVSKVTESAFQKLASLGVITEEKPFVDTKENVLKKLASRSGISITPAGGASSSLNSSILITRTKPKHKPGPKSAMLKQKAKKIKIDLTKESTDIDKDFNSLISFLSTAAKAEEISDQLDTVPKHSSNTEIDDADDIEVDPNLNINDSCVNQDQNESSGREVNVSVVDNQSLQDMDGESHDESKSFSHSSEHPDDSDDKITTTISKVKNVIEEGSAEILLSATKNVFYNKVQEFNRDMSIAALTVFSEMHQQDPRTRNRGKKRKAAANSETLVDDSDPSEENVFEAGKKCENGITILEALSATGLRSIRYAREIPGVKEVIANDLSEDAVEAIKKNLEHNGVQDLVTTSRSDASMLMYQRQANQEWYDAIDLDPYGCPSRFLDSAVQAVRDGGLLLVTCTDMAVLAGNSPETCYVKYGAISIRSPACHEMALRIALQCIESHANRYGRYIVPLVSFSADFYIRLIVQVYTSPVTCKRTTSKLSMVYQCAGCHTHTLQPLGLASQSGTSTQPKFHLGHGPPVNTNCFHCNYKHHMGGPIWSAPMYNAKFLESMLKVVENGRFTTSKRMQGMLEVIREELPEVPLYYTISGLCTKLHCQAIPLIDIRSAILNTGYRVSSSHAAPTAIKTNAPSKIIWDIMRCWVHMNPVSQKRLVTGSVAAAIILEPPNLIANFDIHPKARPSSSMRKLLRYQPNPEKNWGPGMRARCNQTAAAPFLTLGGATGQHSASFGTLCTRVLPCLKRVI